MLRRGNNLRVAVAAALMAAALLALPRAARCAEFEATDKLTASGYTLLKTSADVAGWAFSVGGSSFSVLYGKVGVGTSAPQALLHVSSAPGVSGDLFVISTAASNVIRMTGDGSVYANKFYGNFSGATGTPPGDNLGSHTGAQALNMGAYAVDGSSHVSAGYYQIAGATVIAIPGTSNLFVGPRAGESNTTGSYNVFVGSQSGYGSTTGAQTVSLGVQAGGGGGNVFAGYQAGAGVTSGSDIVGIGVQSAYFNTIGGYNTYGGYRSGYLNVNGSSNTCFGYQSCLNVRGSANTAIGSGALSGSGSPATVSSNTVMGYRAGYNVATGGSDNIFIGFQAGYNVTTGSGNIILGYDQRGAAADTMKLNIGGLIYGDLNATTGMKAGIGTASPAAKLDVLESDAAEPYILKVSTGPGSYHLVVTTAGPVGIGTGSPDQRSRLHVYKRYDAASGANDYMLYSRAWYAGGFWASGAKQSGRVDAYATFTSGTMASLAGVTALGRKTGAGPVTNLVGLLATVNNTNATSALVSGIGIYLPSAVRTGTLTNEYALYQADTSARNYFGGSVLIGTNTYAYTDAMLEVLASTASAYSLQVGTGSVASHLVVSTAGYVGINNMNPAAKLDIRAANGSEHLRFTNATNSDSSGLYAGSGSPESAVSAQLSSLYMDRSGGKIYAKTSGDGTNSGWTELLQPSTGAPKACMRRTTSYSVTANVLTQIPFNTVDYGFGAVATDTSTGSITVYQSGYYMLNGFLYHGALTTYDTLIVKLHRNDSSICETRSWYPPSGVVELSAEVSCIQYLDAGDKITMKIEYAGNPSSPQTTYTGSSDQHMRMCAVMANPAAIDMSGSGTAGRLAKFTGTKTIGDSIITESSSKIGISSSAPTHTLSVNGNINFNNGRIYMAGYANPVFVSSANSSNLFAGWDAGLNVPTQYNTFIGHNAGRGEAGATSIANTAVGLSSYYYAKTGSYNAYLGVSAGLGNRTGSANACAGLYACVFSSGSANTHIGWNTGTNNNVMTGSYSSTTVLGAQAGKSLTTGSDNLFIGYSAGYNVTTGSGNITIGYNLTGAAADKMKLDIGGLLYGNLASNGRNVGINTFPAAGAPILTINSVGAMKVPVGTTAQRPGAPYLGMLRFNTTENRPELYTTKWQPLALGTPCHGGLVSFTGSDVVHTFYGDGMFNCDRPVTAQVLVVGGGGGGGWWYGGGGGGGGVVECTSYSISTGAKTVTVGAGGTLSGTACGAVSFTSGGNSSFDTITAYGGGRGGGWGPSTGCTAATGASSGGSGGGGYGNAAGSGGSGTGGTYGSGTCGVYGYAGAAGGASPAYGGGGGGAGGTGSYNPSNGGPGRSSSISGVATYYGAGGGAGSGNTTSSGQVRVIESGRPGYGSGGGADTYNGGFAGSGVVIIRYSGKAQN